MKNKLNADNLRTYQFLDKDEIVSLLESEKLVLMHQTVMTSDPIQMQRAAGAAQFVGDFLENIKKVKTFNSASEHAVRAHEMG